MQIKEIKSLKVTNYQNAPKKNNQNNPIPIKKMDLQFKKPPKNLLAWMISLVNSNRHLKKK